MAVESVNNNNTGYYTAGAALIGGGIGATVGHATKSILKDGNFTDEFVKSVENQMLNTEQGKLIVELCKLEENSPNYTKEMAEVLKKHAKVLGKDPKELSNAKVELAQMFGGNERIREMVADMKAEIAMTTGEIITTGKDSNIEEILKRNTQKNLDKVFDKTQKTFIENTSEKDVLKWAKKSARNLKLKAAGIYGTIGAAALGLTAFLLSGNGNSENS